MKQNARIILNLICEFGSVFGRVFEDKKISFADAGLLLALSDELIALKDLEFSTLISDLKDAISPDEFSNTLKEMADKFDIPQDEIEMKIEKSISGLSLIVSGVISLGNVWLRKAQ